MPRPRVAAPLLLAAAADARTQLPFDIPKPAAPTGTTLFTSRSGTRHTVERGAPPRQGPNLAGVFQRKAGTLDGFRYSAGFANADFIWDDAHLDAWLTDPQKLIPGAQMRYRQVDPVIRGKLIAWLKEQH